MLLVNVCELHVIILRFHYVDAVKWRKYTLFDVLLILPQPISFVHLLMWQIQKTLTKLTKSSPESLVQFKSNIKQSILWWD